jgi:3-dehydrosphinganine reductase
MPPGSEFSGKHVLVTGGSSGIGLALARKLASAGANLWILARDPVRLDSACRALLALRQSAEQQVGTLAGDVADWPSTRALIEDHIQRYGAFDLVINSAGTAKPGKFLETDLDAFRSMMEVNYFGTLHVLKAALPAMVERGSGYVVNISSLGGFLALYGYSAYGPSKFAVRALSDTLRYELKENGIGISVVFPPDTQTPQLEYETQFKPPVLVELDKANKILRPEEVANAILKGVSKRRYIITPGFDSTLYFSLSNLFGLMYPVLDLMIAQARRTICGAQRSGAAEDHRGHEHITDPDKV